MVSEEGGRVVPGVTKIITKIPVERVGVLVGGGGRVVRTIRDRLGVVAKVDSTTGSVVLEPEDPATPAANLIKARDYVEAIGHGFSPERAERVLEEDQVILFVDLRAAAGDSENHLKRIKGRIIGEGGKARRNLEEMTGTYISVGSDSVAIIGGYEEAEVARKAIEMLAEGREHSTVYRHVRKMMTAIGRKKPGIL